MCGVLVLKGCYPAILFSGIIPRKPHSEDRLVSLGDTWSTPRRGTHGLVTLQSHWLGPY